MDFGMKIMATEHMECLKKFEDHHNGNDDSTPNRELRNSEIPVEFRNGISGQTESVAGFYEGSIILVTGGTGFVGKALLEKLLRSCPGIDTIYILMRPKRGLTVEQRYKELLKNPVFDRIRNRWPERLSKLVAITGDVSAPGLGVSVQELALLTTVTLLFHSAATVRFTEPLHAATTLNVQGTASLLQLAKSMPKLQALVHVSTAYSNAPLSYIEERVYPPPYDPMCVMECAKMLPPDAVETIIQGDHPNTYTLTKALAEYIVYSHAELPVCIIRPSIVTAAYQEPSPGWIDNVYGVTGIIMEISRGTYRSGYCREHYVVDLVPVDMVVNSCILAAWRQGARNPGRCPVYNVTSGSINPLQWGQFTSLCVKWARENPTKYVMWYPSFSFTQSRLVNTFWEITCHFLPAFVYDLLLKAQGRKAIMMKLARRFKMAAATGEYFANHEWQFGISQLNSLHNEAAATKDAASFSHWPTHFSWESYIGAYMLGIRKFILKDSAESLPVARTRLRRSFDVSNLYQSALEKRGGVCSNPSHIREDAMLNSGLFWIHRFVQFVTGYYVFRFISGRLR